MQILAALLHKHIKEIKPEEKNKRGKRNKFGLGEKKKPTYFKTNKLPFKQISS